jgi:site-specific recombinase XerD
MALINDGVDVRLVQEFLGHASISFTAPASMPIVLRSG